MEDPFYYNPMGKRCQFFWVTVLDLVVELPSRRSPLLRVYFVMSFLCYTLAFLSSS